MSEVDLGYNPMLYLLENKFSEEVIREVNLDEEKHRKEKFDIEEKINLVGEYQLIINYPLTTPYKGKFKFDNPTIIEMVKLISETYGIIYYEENESTSNEVTTGKNSPEANRDESKGSYGIWGHHLGDLMLHSLYINENEKILTVGVDS